MCINYESDGWNIYFTMLFQPIKQKNSVDPTNRQHYVWKLLYFYDYLFILFFLILLVELVWLVIIYHGL